MSRIVVEQSPHGHWDAWFADRPFETWGGDSPGTAVDRLWSVWLNNPKDADERANDDAEKAT